MPRLTKTLIQSATADGTERYLWDSDLPRFGVSISAAGRKTYLIRYRTASGASRKYRFARCVEMPPEKARERARALFVRIANGEDPSQARTRPSASDATVADLAEHYMRLHAAPHKKPRSAANDRRLWDLHILPKWRHRAARAITRADVMDLHAGMRKHPANANRALALLSKAFNLSEVWGMRQENSNPCRHVKRFPEPRAGRSYTATELAALGRALAEFELLGRVERNIVALVRLWLMTGARNSEIRTARLEWLDREASCLRLPDSKTGAKVIDVPPAAWEIIDAIDRPDDNPYIVPGRLAGKPLANVYVAFRAIFKLAGIRGRNRPHDLRHTFGSTSHASGLSLRQVATLLGHKQLSTTERYVHDASRLRSAEHASGVIHARLAGLPDGAPTTGA